MTLAPIYSMFVKDTGLLSALATSVQPAEYEGVLYDIRDAAYADLYQITQSQVRKKGVFSPRDAHNLFGKKTPTMIRFAALICIMVQMGVWDSCLFPVSTRHAYDLFVWRVRSLESRRPGVDYAEDFMLHLDPMWMPLSKYTSVFPSSITRGEGMF